MPIPGRPIGIKTMTVPGSDGLARWETALSDDCFKVDLMTSGFVYFAVMVGLISYFVSLMGSGLISL